MNSILDKLRNAKPDLATHQEVQVFNPTVIENSDLFEITLATKEYLDEMQQIQELTINYKDRFNILKQLVIENFQKVIDNKDKYLPDRTVEDWIKNDLGISKGYFYSELRAYRFLLDKGKKDLYGAIDSRLVNDISKIEHKKYQTEMLTKLEKKIDFNKQEVSLHLENQNATKQSELIEEDQDQEEVVYIARKSKSIQIINKALFDKVLDLITDEGISLRYLN